VAFRGTFEYTLDAKNRLTIPAKFRASFADGVVLGRLTDNQGCIGVWRASDYDVYTNQTLEQYRPGSPQRLKLERFFFGSSHDTELDAAGRVMVPPFLLEHAGIDKDTVVMGVGNRLEVWDRAAWSDTSATLAGEVEEITSQLDNAA
jgi:MraZ protein